MSFTFIVPICSHRGEDHVLELPSRNKRRDRNEYALWNRIQIAESSHQVEHLCSDVIVHASNSRPIGAKAVLSCEDHTRKPPIFHLAVNSRFLDGGFVSLYASILTCRNVFSFTTPKISM
jgi:hypothetical protein